MLGFWENPSGGTSSAPVVNAKISSKCNSFCGAFGFLSVEGKITSSSLNKLSITCTVITQFISQLTRKLTLDHLKHQFPVMYSLLFSCPLLGPCFTPVDLEQGCECASGKGLMHVGKDGQKLNPVSSYHIPELSISIQSLCELMNHIWCSVKISTGCKWLFLYLSNIAQHITK